MTASRAPQDELDDDEDDEDFVPGSDAEDAGDPGEDDQPGRTRRAAVRSKPVAAVSRKELQVWCGRAETVGGATKLRRGEGPIFAQHVPSWGRSSILGHCSAWLGACDRSLMEGLEGGREGGREGGGSLPTRPVSWRVHPRPQRPRGAGPKLAPAHPRLSPRSRRPKRAGDARRWLEGGPGDEAHLAGVGLESRRDRDTGGQKVVKKRSSRVKSEASSQLPPTLLDPLGAVSGDWRLGGRRGEARRGEARQGSQ
jgi:hypothetical protein